MPVAIATIPSRWLLPRKGTTKGEKRKRERDREGGGEEAREKKKERTIVRRPSFPPPSSLNLSTQRNENRTVEVIKRVLANIQKIRYQDNEIISPAFLSRRLSFPLRMKDTSEQSLEEASSIISAAARG